MIDSRYGVPHTTDPDEFVRVADVVKIFGDVVAVRSVNLSVRRNEIFALLG
ncbi:MAG: polyamine ABC transporter ATP-binding protein, partial [Burkholderiaceae bacterium]|nr:polyamine ABC transporter ATP-binding protein [Burkholderiaceae bacterium]